MGDFDRSVAPSPSRTGVFLQVGLGIGLVFVLHLVVGSALTAIPLVAFALVPYDPTEPGSETVMAVMSGLYSLQAFWMLGLSIAQLPYVVPLAAAAWFVRRPVALGVGIGAALTLVLQTTCYGVVGVVVFGLYAAHG